MAGKDRPRLDTLSVEVIIAGSWHNFYPGETRIVLDLSRLVSFYDTSLSPSLVRKRRGQERWQHRLEGMAESDIQYIMQRLTNILGGSAPSPSANRIDWATLIKVVVTRFSDRLDLVRRVLNTTDSQIEVGLGDSKLSERAKQAQRHFSTMLGPYTLASATPSNASDVSWASPVYKECSVAHTSYIARQQHGFTHSERLLLAAIEDTSGEICRVVTKMWAKGVLAGLDGQLEYLRWVTLTFRPLAEWTVSELCYLPTWPFFRSSRRRPLPGPGPEIYQSDRRTAYADEEHNNFEEDWETKGYEAEKAMKLAYYLSTVLGQFTLRTSQRAISHTHVYSPALTCLTKLHPVAGYGQTTSSLTSMSSQAQGSGAPPMPPVPSSPPSSGVRRHHTISASSRSARQGARESSRRKPTNSTGTRMRSSIRTGLCRVYWELSVRRQAFTGRVHYPRATLEVSVLPAGR
ncbi:PLP-dependent transferase [Salix suchowensis]|nr:PLP-dependent transferase [Salix suchowensis]